MPARAKMRLVLAAIVLLIFLAGVLHWIVRPREPEYQGRKLTDWLKRYEYAYFYATNIPEGMETNIIHETDYAVQQMGTNAIPWLLKLVQETDTPFEEDWNEWLSRRNVSRWKFRMAKDDHDLSEYGFQALGAAAVPAIPSLTKLLDAPDSQVRRAATLSLRALDSIDKEAMKEAIPVLVRHLNDSDEGVRFVVTDTLGYLHLWPELSVSPLITKLEAKDTSPKEAYKLLIALGKYRTNAIAASNVLRKYATNSDSLIAAQARDSLFKITNVSANPY